jgi:hypothetical protein
MAPPKAPVGQGFRVSHGVSLGDVTGSTLGHIPK